VVPAAESSSSNVLLYVLIGVGVLVVLAAIGFAVWMSRRKNTRQSPAQQYGMPGQPTQQPMAPGWYADPQRQARLRWFDGNQWTPNTQN
jgi:flagellar basal body-associated protein FliL